MGRLRPPSRPRRAPAGRAPRGRAARTCRRLRRAGPRVPPLFKSVRCMRSRFRCRRVKRTRRWGEHDEPPLRGPPPPPPVPQPTLPAGTPWGQVFLTHRRRGAPLRGPQQPRLSPPPPRRGRAARAQRRRMPGVRGPPPPARSCAACPAVCAVLERFQNQVHHTHMTPVPFFEKRRVGHVGICL